MNDIEKRQLSAGIAIVIPVMAWLATVRQTEVIPHEHRAKAIALLILATPHKPLLLSALLAGITLAGLVLWILARVGKTEFEGAPYRKFLRGTRIVSPERLARKTADRKRRHVTVADIPIPVAAEKLHVLIGGGTGTGKSTIFRELALGAVLRRDRIICLDPNGDMMSKFWREGDVILNPYDARTAGWSFFNEIRADYDFHRYAMSIVPVGKTADAEEWAGYARLLLRETARKLSLLGQPSIRELFRWTTITPPGELQEFLTGTLAESLFAGSSEASKALTSARFLLSDKLPEHVTMPGGEFSLRTWLEDRDGGNLWITWREDMAPALKPLISAWIDALFVSILSMPEDSDRRIWAFIDELASLEKLASLEPALTKGRKHGLRVVAGLQSTAQLDDIYGRDTAKTLRSCFSSLAVLRISKSDPATAEDFSKSLGEHEVERDRTSRNVSTSSSTSGTQAIVERERVVTASQLTSLPDLSGYLAIVGDTPIARFKTRYRPYKVQVPAFVERKAGGFGE
ncbi:Coupling protein TraD [Paraburkholderia ultramafica]|uniref:Coupling protein TraD n=1 Tax=Paraburkholderia ultramafica TaxID=1544867 RepID=A0A6S7BJR2_9BURK|nr:type IV secretion system DNA-binding domain-containing protein [Paraburkholderia ultramafica]CAB3802733.1 Coupling protein TraD [Paraburkholderia ultramafica]